MELPWAMVDPPPAHNDVFVMASRFELTSAWRSPVFFAQAMRIWLQARRSPGIHGVSLRAHPLRGEFWTLLAWMDEAALYAFARAQPHKAIVRQVRPWAREATFRFWTVPAEEIIPASSLWADAVRRIAAPDETSVPGKESVPGETSAPDE